jgi:integrase/recombinase XerD
VYEDFLKEKQYLTNVSPRTLEWYKLALAWWTGDPKKTVIKMREAGLSARSINSYRTALNSYLHWSESPHRIPRMKCEEKILPAFSVEDIQKIHKWKPKTRCERRLQAIMLTLADTGTRIDEVLTLQWNQVDYDNLLITVTGKGSKQRRIPFSFELRKTLFAYQRYVPGTLVFCTRLGKKLGRRNVLRDVKRTCRLLGITPPERTLHAFRHTFAINYLRRGGNVFFLQKMLGHSSLEMTRRYANVLVDDLQAVHQKFSMLGGGWSTAR